MKRIYLAAAFLMLFLICTAYSLSYDFSAKEMPFRTETPASESETMLSAKANAGNPTPVYQYYLTENHGYVRVYCDDQKTLYENTSIRIETLPQSLQQEIRDGKYIRSEKELYDFLENYSS